MKKIGSNHSTRGRGIKIVEHSQQGRKGRSSKGETTSLNRGECRQKILNVGEEEETRIGGSRALQPCEGEKKGEGLEVWRGRWGEVATWFSWQRHVDPVTGESGGRKKKRKNKTTLLYRGRKKKEGA